ncbi:MAG: NAD(P)/FAD-dependent oxidoreductase [Planctomycetota bacterium]|nr:NAD(P)/FAD-dependent oxidoreductase [Planctomycetota bacterium]
MRNDLDVAIIGAGPAGSSLAALLATRGLAVTLFEKDRFPRDKLCGEFLSGGATRHLEEIGCLEGVQALDPARMSRARFTTPSAGELVVDLPDEALGVSRRRLDEVLLRHAASRGAEILEGAEVREVRASPDGEASAVAELEVRRESGVLERRRARLAVGAHGRRSALDRRLGRPFLNERHPFVAFQRHHWPLPGEAGRRLVDELRGAVEIHTFEGGYCGLSFVETGEINVCLLCEEAWLKGRGAADWGVLVESLGRASRPLGRRLAALEPSDSLRVVAGIPLVSKETRRGPLLFVGDAAGMVAPFSGDGQAMALESACHLSALIATVAGPGGPGGLSFDAIAARWDRRWKRAFGVRQRLARCLQRLLLRETSARWSLRVAKAVPGLATLLVRATRGK